MFGKTQTLPIAPVGASGKWKEVMKIPNKNYVEIKGHLGGNSIDDEDGHVEIE